MHTTIHNTYICIDTHMCMWMFCFVSISSSQLQHKVKGRHHCALSMMWVNFCSLHMKSLIFPLQYMHCPDAFSFLLDCTGDNDSKGFSTLN